MHTEFDPFAAVVYRSAGTDAPDAEADAGAADAMPPAPPALLPALRAGGVQRYTRLYSRLPAHTLLARISTALQRLHARVTEKPEELRLKATMPSEQGAVTMAARIMAVDAEADPALLAVEFMRRQGDLLQFHKLFGSLASMLEDATCAPPVEAEIEEAGTEAPPKEAAVAAEGELMAPELL